jgi:DNA replication protein DnaC
MVFLFVATLGSSLPAQLAKAQHENRLEDELLHFTKPKLLFVDERGSILVTSNLTTSEWGNVFGDPFVATAILDRLLHHSHVVTIRGDSCRLREKRKSGLPKPITNAATAA